MNAAAGPRPEEKRAQHRDDCQAHHEGRGHGRYGGHRDGREEPALKPLEPEERQEDHDDDHRGMQDGIPDFSRGVGDDCQGRPRGCGRGILPQTAPDILHVHDGVIDDHADGHRESAQRHGTDAHASDAEDDDRDGERQGNGCQGDEDGAEVQQKEEQDHGHHDRAIAERLAEIADGVLDEVALTEEDLGLDSGRERGLQFVQGGFDFPGEGERVGAGRLVDAEDDAGTAVDARVAAHGLDGFHHGGDIADENRTAADRADDGAGDVFRPRGHGEVPHHDFPGTGLEVAAGGAAGGRRDGRMELLERDAEGGEPLRIGLDLKLPDAPADGQDLGNAADALQAAPDGPVGEGAQLPWSHRAVLAAEPDEEDLAHERGDGRHARLRLRRQCGKGSLQPFLHELAGTVNVRAPCELGEDQGEAHIGAGPEPVEAARALDGGFDGLGDKGFHLLRREARGFGEDGHGGLRHVRQDLDRQTCQGLPSEDEHEDREADHERPVREGEADEAVKHGGPERREVSAAWRGRRRGGRAGTR